jgi:hypothetical protein
MKTLKLILISMLFLCANALTAQVSVVIGTPPPWGPAGYNGVRYYYVPDVESYYDVQESRFIYLDKGVWVHRAYLPTRYRSYDLYSGYKVVMVDYHGVTPYKNYGQFRSQYAKGYRGSPQKTIGMKPGNDKAATKPVARTRSNAKMSPAHDNNATPGNSNKGASPGNNTKGAGPGHGKKK